MLRPPEIPVPTPHTSSEAGALASRASNSRALGGRALGGRALGSWGSFIAVGGAGLLFVLLGSLGLFRPLDDLTWDSWTRLTPATLEPGIVLVQIDETSLERYGRLGNWDRQLYGQAISNLLEAGAKKVGVDVFFPERTPKDAAIAPVLEDRRVVLADAVQYGERIKRNAAFKAAHYGLVLVPSSREGTIRRSQLAFSLADPPGGPPVGSLEPSLAAAMLNLPRSSLNTRSSQIRYAGPPGSSFGRLSFADVVAGNFRYAEVQDRLVLIGVTATGLERDQLLTPYLERNKMYGASLPAPGVEVQAQIVHTVLRGGFFEFPYLFALLLGVALMVLLTLRPLNLPLTLGLSLLSLALSYGLHRLHISLPPAALCLSFPLALALHSVLALREAAGRIEVQLRRMGEGQVARHAPLMGRLELLERVEQRLALERAQLDLLIGNVEQPLFLTDLSGTVLVSNPVGQELLRPGERLADVLPERLRLAPEDFNLLEVLVGSGRLEQVTPEGVLTLSRVCQGGRAVAMVGMFTRADHWVGISVRQDQSAEELIHSMRTSLTSLLGFMQYLEETLDGNGGEILSLMLLEGRRMSSTLERQVSLEHSREDSPLERLDLAALVRRVSGTLAPTFEKRNITLKLELPPRLSVQGDDKALCRVVLCLLDNAARYSSVGTEVWLTLKQRGSQALLEVSDLGLGISQADQGRIFSRHYRTDEARARSVEGNGMSLWTAKELVRAHGGDLLVSSTLGEGSTFTVVLPLQSQRSRGEIQTPKLTGQT